MRTTTRVVMLALYVMVAACTGGTIDSTTTIGRSTTATAPDPTTHLPSQDLACVYLSDIIALPIEDPESRGDTIDSAVAALETMGITGVEAFAADVLGVDFEVPEDGAEEFEAAHAAIDGSLALLTINADPLLTARALRAGDEGLRAAPIHAVAPVGHYKLAPGSDATSFPDGDLSSDEADPNGPDFGYVAVVDSGIAIDGREPLWMFGPDSLTYSASDIEPSSSSPSHGTFVAGLIRQLAPTHAVSIASARPIDPSRTKTYPFKDVIETTDDISTELHVFEAIERLMIRHETLGAPVDALNLSLGAYSCDELGDGTLSIAEDDIVLTLSSALQAWRSEHDNSEVIAAAGNENHEHNGRYVEFWPAALPGVQAIAASSLAFDEVAWDRRPMGDLEVDVTGARPWVTASAPGVDLLSIGDSDGNVYRWGGSSFATAVASALTVSGAILTPEYGLVPGLSYVEADAQVTSAPATTTP